VDQVYIWIITKVGRGVKGGGRDVKLGEKIHPERRPGVFTAKKVVAGWEKETVKNGLEGGKNR